MNLRRLALTTRAQLQMTFRNRIALFWAIAFPMILLSLLGVLFGHTATAGRSSWSTTPTPSRRAR